MVNYAVNDRDQFQSAPLWMETKNQDLHTGSRGNNTAKPGARNAGGRPLELFSAGETRELGTRKNGGEEQLRTCCSASLYALEAADAETVGGFSPAAFVLNTPEISQSLLQAIANASAGTAARDLNEAVGDLTGEDLEVCSATAQKNRWL